MSITKTQVKQGTYYDSVILMQLQASLAKLPDVLNVGVMMGTEANKDLLTQSNLLNTESKVASADDLIIAIQAKSATAAEEALAQVESLLTNRKRAIDQQDYIPQSIEAAAKSLTNANWVMVSVPGRYAAGVAREALRLKKHVFLYSDNVSLEDEIALKQQAAQQNQLLMGPDCGTAIVNGVGLGFANHVRRGSIGVIGASGTGLQQVTARIHQLGDGITHALGTGGRDLSKQVGAITTRQSLDLLNRDPNTKVIVLISKPPAPAVANQLLQIARTIAKPTVINFIGYTPPPTFPHTDNLHFVTTLDQTAALAVNLAKQNITSTPTTPQNNNFAPNQRYLRGLFSGGTLAYEALLILQNYLPAVYSNAPLDKKYKLANVLVSQEHSIIDLGEDEFTVGRLHPMMDNTLRIQRLMQEAADPEVAVILLDVVLGYGSHPDPVGELAPAIAQIKDTAKKEGRTLAVVAIVTGTDEDPQNMAEQIQQLQAVDVHVETNNESATCYVGELLQSLNNISGLPPVNLAVLDNPLAAINVGLESFIESLNQQGVPTIHVNWKPPAGGKKKLMSILERMKQK